MFGEFGRRQDELGMDDLPVPPEAGERPAHHPPRALRQDRLEMRAPRPEEHEPQAAFAAHPVRPARRGPGLLARPRRGLVALDQDLEGHAPAFAGLSDARPEPAVDDRIGQMPD
jgi:hypothetical protein